MWGWPAPLKNLYFDSFLLICASFVVRTRGIVCVVYLLFRLANYKDPCKRCVLAQLRLRALLYGLGYPRQPSLPRQLYRAGKFLKKLWCCVEGSVTR